MVATILHIDDATQEISMLLVSDEHPGKILGTLKKWKIIEGVHTWSECLASQYEIEEIK